MNLLSEATRRNTRQILFFNEDLRYSTEQKETGSNRDYVNDYKSDCRKGMRRKYTQLKAYSKIMKLKKSTGEIKEVKQTNQEALMEQEPPQKMEEVQQNDAPNEEDFQDEFEDQFEEEEAWVSASDQEEQGRTVEGEGMKDQRGEYQEKVEVFTGTNKNLQKGEVLDFDNNAYDMLHRLNIQWPSLSIDFMCKQSPFVETPPFQSMHSYPYQVYTVQGSSNNTSSNSIYLTKWCKLHKTKFDDDIENGEDEQLSNDDQPELVVQRVETTYSVNRIRSLMGSPIVAFWNEAGELQIMDLTLQYERLLSNHGNVKKEKAKSVTMKSQCEGFALSWNSHRIGQITSGNNLGIVETYQNDEHFGSWTKTATYNYHQGSVEDIVYSPSEPHVFASCSSDKTLQIVDTRVQSYNKSQIFINAHERDVNVCDWNKLATHLLVTGSDDGFVKVWDLRRQKKGSIKEQIICFKWHQDPITSIMFQPNEESNIAVASEDNSVSIWDMSVENEEEETEIPNELMFIHQGQEEIKEVRFHPMFFQMIVSSASDGINIFKPSYELPPQQVDNFQEDLKQPPIRQEDLDKYLQKMSLQ